jgi:hypothetical protein
VKQRAALAVAVALALAPAAAAADDTAPAAEAKPARPKPKKPLPPYKPGPPDPIAVAAAEDANLEASSRRRGVMFSVALGSAAMLGRNIQVDGLEAESTGTGGLISFRFSYFANREALVYFELAGRVLPYKDSRDETQFNTYTHLGFGGQQYVTPALWLRTGLAFASFAEREQAASGTTTRFDYGVAAVGGGGLELARGRWFALALELAVTAGYQFPGLIGSGGLALSASFY